MNINKIIYLFLFGCFCANIFAQNFQGRIEEIIDFEPAYKADITLAEINKLISFSELDEPEIEYFGGKYTSSLSFVIDQALDTGSEYFLNLGSFDATATVNLNNLKAVELWSRQDFKIANYMDAILPLIEVGLMSPLKIISTQNKPKIY